MKLKYKKYKFMYFLLLNILIVNTTFFNNTYIFANNKQNINTNLELHCNSDIAMDYDSGNVLYDKNSKNKIFPASTTKILTCILAIENLELNDTTVVSNNVINSIPPESSVMGVKAGELYTIKELLYGLMLPSRK